MSGASGEGPVERLPEVRDLDGILALRSRIAAAAAREARIPAEGGAALPAVASAVVAALLAGGHGTVTGALRGTETGGLEIRLTGGGTADGSPPSVSLPPLPPLLPGGVEVHRQEDGSWIVTAPPSRAPAPDAGLTPAAALLAAETAFLRLTTPEVSGGELAPVPVRPLVEELRAAFAGRALESGVSLDVRTPPDELAVQANRDRLLGLLADLLGNAFRYSRQGDRVTLGVTPEGARVRITVRDTGRGIPAEVLPRLFQWDWTTGASVPAGAGPGLALVRKEIEAMGGTVSAESEVGRGTDVHLVLPRP
jgi:hypothetical protein